MEGHVPVTYPIIHRLERLALAKAYIALTRVMVDSVFGKKPADHSLLLIGSAIMVGNAESRPMNATKIAHYVGLPRSTVIRKLNEFLRAGVIARHGNVYLLSKERACNQTKYVTEAMRIFRVAEKNLKASELRSTVTTLSADDGAAV
jgi:predicted transcriptional regulator